ncbi:MAG: hypothetical protein Q4A74_08480 [Cardiobacteriaceae bacterium]|nr:hypothetical protein [Cardiobacteriaceae bacterium]
MLYLLSLFLALAFNALACLYLYRAAPQQQWQRIPLARVYAKEMAWRCFVAALLFYVLIFAGYGIFVLIAVSLFWFGFWPLLPLCRYLNSTTYMKRFRVLRYLNKKMGIALKNIWRNLWRGEQQAAYT